MAQETCRVVGCDRALLARGWCGTHYGRWLTTGDVSADIPIRRPLVGSCSVEGCDRPVKIKGWCQSHYARWKRNGDVGSEPIGARFGRCCSVEGCGEKHFGKTFCSTHYQQWRRWGDPLAKRPIKRSLNHGGYVVVAIHGRGTKLEHRMVMEAFLRRPLERCETVHHRNGVRDDNRLENLELWAARHPAGQRVEDLVAFAYEILQKYADDAF